MKIDRFGGWLALGANLGVVAGLVLLAVELRQNTQVVRGQATASLMSGLASAEIALMGEDATAAFVKAVESPETLTSEDIFKVWAMLNVITLAARQTHEMYVMDLASEEAWRTAVGWASGTLNFPFGRVWWSEMKGVNPKLPIDLVEAIDAELVKTDPHDMRGMLERMKKAARESEAK